MIRNLSRLGCLVVLALTIAAVSVSSESVALARTVGPTKIRPHQFFAGVVNGMIENATVKVACPISGTNGRALSGQTLSVTSPLVVASNFGYTGSRGRAIVANVGPAASAAETVRFTRYNHPQPFPTNIPVPRDGTGVVIFFPVRGSHHARPATVTVSYENVAANGG